MTVNLFLHVPGKIACFECEQIGAYALHPWYKRFVTYAMDHFGRLQSGLDLDHGQVQSLRDRFLDGLPVESSMSTESE